jgi:hypothetical protein
MLASVEYGGVGRCRLPAGRNKFHDLSVANNDTARRAAGQDSQRISEPQSARSTRGNCHRIPPKRSLALAAIFGLSDPTPVETRGFCSVAMGSSRGFNIALYPA